MIHCFNPSNINESQFNSFNNNIKIQNFNSTFNNKNKLLYSIKFRHLFKFKNKYFYPKYHIFHSNFSKFPKRIKNDSLIKFSINKSNLVGRDEAEKTPIIHEKCHKIKIYKNKSKILKYNHLNININRKLKSRKKRNKQNDIIKNSSNNSFKNIYFSIIKSVKESISNSIIFNLKDYIKSVTSILKRHYFDILESKFHLFSKFKER
ncbi:hypothetical protein BCR36DRAFT_370283 [Piromyces finnis]|uniref:Uncharacterized protein n=1 Tax=Piromyces finnis TaxID=1754191 RepID=A0A1Y1V9A1_9FUNG|nr:hypothetical protein BCR36DRAFT_370283 [Piromyces finnis]|eukprot:ORX50252.1 hypothetical protein BCR36DRAFT_370283 [Piromyces finnis]